MEAIHGRIAYISGLGGVKKGPLARFLTPYPEGILAAWLAEHVPASSFLLDPFATSPQFALEAARSGFRIIVSANNPINHFIIETLAMAMPERDFQYALAELSSTRHGEQRLEQYIQSFYQTRCDRCGNLIQADAYIWEDPSGAPTGRIYTCSHCGDSSEHLMTDFDVKISGSLWDQGLHRSRALEKVASINDPERAAVNEALSVYPGRPLALLFTILNKVEGLNLAPNHKRALTALALSVCDQANSLWHYPTGRSRPRQLTNPSKFREHNLWRSIEKAVSEWSSATSPIPVCHWPELPPMEGGICLYNGRIKDLTGMLHKGQVQGVVTIVPRPNQAYWTLSALWTGWLWGREKINPFRAVLKRRRYDWSWHTSALQTAFSCLVPILNQKTQLFALVAESEPAFLSSVILAASLAGWNFQGIAMRADQNLAQLQWQILPPNNQLPGGFSSQISSHAAAAHLTQRGEPTPYSILQAAILEKMATNGSLCSPAIKASAEPYSLLQATLRQSLKDTDTFMRYGSAEQNLENSLWWLNRIKTDKTSLSDQVEKEVFNLLSNQPSVSLSELDRSICKRFPGLFTPPMDLVMTCLESYGELLPEHKAEWQLKFADRPQNRQQDLQNMQKALINAAYRLNYQTDGSNPFFWLDENHHIVYAFTLVITAAVSDIMRNNPYPPEKAVLIYPGSRANLLAFKISRDPNLRQVLENEWLLAKFRHILKLVDNPMLNREIWQKQIDKDPPEYKSSQMYLL